MLNDIPNNFVSFLIMTEILHKKYDNEISEEEYSEYDSFETPNNRNKNEKKFSW